MKCGIHPEKEAVGTCVECGIAFCDECKVTINNKNICKKCVDVFIKKGQGSQRNPSIAAVLSFIVPGAGQVYNGQIGKGVLVLLTCWLFIPWVYGIIDAYVTAQKIAKGEITAKPTSMGCLIALIIGFLFLIPGCLLVTAIAVPNLMRAKISANEALAKATLRSLSTAAESFATTNQGRYPGFISELVYASPPYLSEEYCDQTISGFIYKCTFSPNGYEIIATPAEPGISGLVNYTIITGGVLTP